MVEFYYLSGFQLDFWMYNTFPATYLARLQSHHSQLQKVKKITQGKQFNSYSQGSMIARGVRTPAGGVPGDSYTFYLKMEAITANGIEALFNDVEVSWTSRFSIICL